MGRKAERVWESNENFPNNLTHSMKMPMVINHPAIGTSCKIAQYGGRLAVSCITQVLYTGTKAFHPGSPALMKSLYNPKAGSIISEKPIR